ncbi:hypothetical protein AaE_013140 [Aphanomyces astaci]|uniref:Uncharacterized protein n=1 Tax=Aphanomyces astaci TaxID=112090 RepID=A0A6A4ZBM9_APHAT|nr:hypothetical protein AaE_013140 [Aphanomyces astaci]
MTDATPASIWYAAKQGDLTTLKHLIEVTGHAFDQLDPELKTPFYYGCTYDRVYVLQYLEGLYRSRNVEMPEDQRAWCIVSCLTKDVRLYLEGKTTLNDVIAKREKAARDDELSVRDAAVAGNTSRLRWFLKNDQDSVLKQGDASSVLVAAAEANQLATTAMLKDFVKGQVTPEEFERQLDTARAATTSDNVRKILDGQLSMKDVMLLEKAAVPTPRGSFD